MTTLKRRKVGKTKLEVTELGLGGAPMGGFGATIPDAEAVRLADAGYHPGIRYFDTPPSYGHAPSALPEAEASRGRAGERGAAGGVCGGAEGRRKGGDRRGGGSADTGAAGSLIAPGSEVGMAGAASETLESQGVATRVVSMPCREWFEAADQS